MALLDRDGNSYTTVVIGSQEWIVENFKCTKYANGDPIANITNDALWAADTSGAYCWYNNDIGNKTPYGALYNWYAIDNDIAYLERNGSQESGWRIPSQVDFEALFAELGISESGGIYPDAGGKLKEIGTTHWASPNTGADNSSGLTLIGTGNRDASGVFSNITYVTEVWGSDYYIEVFNNPADAFYYDDIIGAAKILGLPVRLMRDYTEPPEPEPLVTPYVTGKFPSYTHYLTIGSSTTEVFPLNFLETTLVDELTDDVYYRRKFNGALTFTNNNGDDDFDLLYASEVVDPCVKILYKIYREGVLYWEGFFSTTDGKFDLDNCTFEVTPQPDDDYSLLFENADVQYNILAVLPVVATGAVQGSVNVTYTRNRWLMDVIETLANELKAGVTVSSEFFTDATNYATGQPNKLTLLTIAQKSDILRPGSSNPATTAMLSWNELMEFLWAMFQVRWDYDPDTDTINVEHISWWSGSDGLDLTTQLISQGYNKYYYLKEEMPKYEQFNFMESADTNFMRGTIWYDSKCVDQNPESNTRELAIRVTTDLEYLIDPSNAAAISDDGFVILCNYEDGGTYYVSKEPGKIIAYNGLNMHLSWANLHDAYFRHNRVLIEGYLNGSLETFWSARKTKVQEIPAIVCPSDNYDPHNVITTTLGEDYFSGAKGKVKQAEITPAGDVKFTLLYGPADNPITPPEEEKTLLLNQVECRGAEWVVYLSEASAGDITISAYHQIVDSAGDSVCISDPAEDWVVTAGLTEDNYTYTLCDTVPSGGYVYFFFTITGADDYEQDIVYRC